MSVSLELLVAGVSAVFSVLLTGIVSYISWKGRGTLNEIERNTKFRRLMVGDEDFERDDGELEQIEERFDQMREERKREHSETRQQLQEIEEGMNYLTRFVREISQAFNRSDLDETVDPPDPSGDRWRGDSGGTDD